MRSSRSTSFSRTLVAQERWLGRLAPSAGSLREPRELPGVLDAHRDLAPLDASENTLCSQGCPHALAVVAVLHPVTDVHAPVVGRRLADIAAEDRLPVARRDDAATDPEGVLRGHNPDAVVEPPAPAAAHGDALLLDTRDSELRAAGELDDDFLAWGDAVQLHASPLQSGLPRNQFADSSGAGTVRSSPQWLGATPLPV